MRFPSSLQARLALGIGLILTLLWIAAGTTTALILRHELSAVFDSALQETAQRLLPLAVVDIVAREEDEGRGEAGHRLAAIREHSEYFTYVVRDAQGRVLLQSHAADPATFPAYDGPGFRRTRTHRLYNDDALQGSIRITVAEPLDRRAAVARELQIGFGLPLLLVIPIALLAVVLAVRANLGPLRRFRDGLAARHAHDLSPVPTSGLVSEMVPVADTVNALLARLNAAFEAERSFAANAAHELRTPLAGAIAQTQRLRAETADPAAKRRAEDIEATLKRLTRFAERLMQLARAEGGRPRLDRLSDLRIVARVVVEDMERAGDVGRISLELPGRAVRSDLDPDIFAIICRNLIDNALRHGATGTPVTVKLSEDGALAVANDGPVVPAATLERLARRFERGQAAADGSGLGLAIVAAIAERSGSRLVLASPRPGHASGFEARVALPVEEARRRRSTPPRTP